MRHQTKVRKEAHLRVTGSHTPRMTWDSDTDRNPARRQLAASLARMYAIQGRLLKPPANGAVSLKYGHQNLWENTASRKKRVRVSVSVFLEESKGQGAVASLSGQKSSHLMKDSISHAASLPVLTPRQSPGPAHFCVPTTYCSGLYKGSNWDVPVDKCVL